MNYVLKLFKSNNIFEKHLSCICVRVCECVFAKIFCRVLFCFASSPNDSKLKRARQNMRGGVKIKHSLRLTHTHAYTHANAYAATGEMRRISVYCTLLCKHIERNADDDADAGCRLELSLSISLCKLEQKLLLAILMQA